MKKALFSAAAAIAMLLSVTTSFAAGNNTEKFTTADKGSIVKNGNTTLAYDKKGNWVYTIERFAADNLPKDVFETVRNNYGSYYVSGMERIEQPGADAYFLVHMQNKNTVKIVKVSGNETELVEDFIKG